MSGSGPKSGEFFDGKLWFTRKGSLVTLGLTDSAIRSVGEIESIEFPDEGGDYSKGEVVVTIEGSKGSLEVIAPAAGFIEEINSSAKNEPSMVTEDPLEEGWLVRFEIQDPSELREFSGIDSEDQDEDDDLDEDDDEDENEEDLDEEDEDEEKDQEKDE